MKRLLTLLVVLLSVLQVNAQRDLTERRPLWIGVNMGGTWQTSDMKPVGGIGWGMTVSRYTRVSSPSPLYFGWRFRFLDGRNFGYNYHSQSRPQVQANSIVSAQYGGASSDSNYFGNYKMRFDEFALELIVGSNSLRKHGVLLYGFGGAGLNYWKTTTNLLSASGTPYSYSAVSLPGDEDAVKTDLEGLLDDTYETDATGQGGTWSFMPSAGFGFGYQWSNFMIGMEHRTTWALNDIIDGTSHNDLGAATGNNDLYHYDGLVMRWNFNSHHSNNSSTHIPPPPPPNPNVFNNNPNPNPNNTTVVTDPNPNNNNTNQVGGNPNLPVQPPTVNFTTPNVSPFAANNITQNITVQLTHIATRNQISLTINGQVSTDYNYNPVNGVMTFVHTLQPGTNTYYVIATNNAGSADDTQIITYKEGSGNNNTTGTPPTVTITNPSANPYTSTTQTTTVNATVVNVSSVSAITVTLNNAPVTNFTYDSRNGALTFLASLSNGDNNVKITGSNQYGTASDATVIKYGQSNAPVIAPPVVMITTPSACPHQTKISTQAVSATITNVTQASHVNVVLNNQPVTNFIYTQQRNQAVITFTATLVSGNNPFTVTGTNAGGTDSKSCVIVYKVSSDPPAAPPVVTITSPSACPFNSRNASHTITATVTNVSQKSQVTVVYNNQTLTNFNYTQQGSNAQISFVANLNSGANNVSVTGTNTAGTDSKSCVLNYAAQGNNNPVPVAPPVVTITNPSVSPYQTSVAAQTVTATITNVSQASQVTITFNGNPVTNFTFTPGVANSSVSFPVTLNSGTNTATVKGTNTAGSDTKSADLVYRVNTVPPTVDINNPPNSPYDVYNAAFTMTAVVQNVSSASEITVKVGSTVVTGWTYDMNTKILSYPATLAQGNTVFKVGAQNANGQASDQATVVLKSNQNPMNSAPVIALITPASATATTTTQQYAVTMNVTGITSTQNVVVKVNNATVTSNVSYNTTSKQLTFTAPLGSGSNTIVVTATNSYGSDTKTLTVTYNAPNRTSPGNNKPKSSEPKKSEPSKSDTPKDTPKETPAPKTSPSTAPSNSRGGGSTTTPVSKPR
jgi:large repetitive protein